MKQVNAVATGVDFIVQNPDQPNQPNDFDWASQKALLGSHALTCELNQLALRQEHASFL